MKIKTKLLLAAMALNLALGSARATVSFENDGTTNGWTTLWQEDGQGFVADVGSPAYKGASAIQCRTVFRTTYGGRYHTECRKGGQCTMGMDRYYGFAFYLPPDWQFVDQNFNIQQFIGNVNGCSGGQPVTMTRVNGHSLVTRIVTGPDGCTRTAENITAATNVTAGAWHRIVIHGNWQSDNTGVFEFWYDGVKKISRSGIPTIPNDDTVFNLAVGNYSNGWHDDGFMVGTQAVRDIFIDQVRTGSTYADVDPAGWSDPNFVKIVARHSGKVANVSGGSTADGAAIIQWPYSADSNQNDEWQITDVGSGGSKIVNRKSGKAMNVQNASLTNGAPVIQWTYSSGSSANDEWQVIDIGGGYRKILNRNSGLALNVSGASTADGAQIIQWPYSNNSSRNDEWQLINVP